VRRIVVYVLNADTVRDAYRSGMRYLRQYGVEQDSRAGRVLVSPCPVTVVTSRPRERVLLDPLRDANPYFHIAEALWMLTGREDSAFLDRYVHDFGKRFAEPDGRVHGAYGYRWRWAFGHDQLDVVVRRLSSSHTDRQCVVQMWDPRHGYSNDLTGGWRDRPCNVTAFLRVRPERGEPVLDLTVCARSGDAVWGVHGANAVHFSILQEYLAAGVGVGVGRMYQVVNNYHAYVDVLDRVWPYGGKEHAHPYEPPLREPPRPIVTNFATFDRELAELLQWVDDGQLDHVLPPLAGHWKNEWLRDTALPMLHAHAEWVSPQFPHIRARLARSTLRAQVKSEDWRRAALEWTERRMNSHEVLGEPETTTGGQT
jgi:thymidylate synthase